MAHEGFHPGQPPYAGLWHSWHDFANALCIYGGLTGRADDTWYTSAIHCPNIIRVNCQLCYPPKMNTGLLHGGEHPWLVEQIFCLLTSRTRNPGHNFLIRADHSRPLARPPVAAPRRPSWAAALDVPHPRKRRRRRRRRNGALVSPRGGSIPSRSPRRPAWPRRGGG